MVQNGMKRHIKSNEKGFTLTELLVAMAITGIVAGAIFTAFLSQNKSYVVQDQVAEMQQNLRAAMYIMLREIRMAGYDPTHKAGAGIPEANSTRINITMDINGNNGDGDGDCNDSNENITYGFSNTNDADHDGIADKGAADLGRKTGSGRGSGFQPVAENIEAIGFAYAYYDPSTGRLATSNKGHVIWAVVGTNGDWYNLDTNDDGNITAADGPGEGNNGVITETDTGTTANTKMVRAVRIWILGRSAHPAPNFLNTKTYVVGKNVITPNDGYRRRLLTTIVKCRNMGLDYD
jgi:type IV pilus assembly protein PilW